MTSHLIEVFWVSGHTEEALDLLLEARQLFEGDQRLKDLEARFPGLKKQADQRQAEASEDQQEAENTQADPPGEDTDTAKQADDNADAQSL